MGVLDDVRGRLVAAREDVEVRMAELAGELDRIDQVLAVIAGSTGTLASGEPPSSEASGPAAADETRAGAGVPVEPATAPIVVAPDLSHRVYPVSAAPPRQRPGGGGISPDRVYEHIGTDWAVSRGVWEALGCHRTALKPHIQALLDAGRIEKRGNGRWTEYRRAAQPDAVAPADGSTQVGVRIAAATPVEQNDGLDEGPVLREPPRPEARRLEEKIEGVLARAQAPLSASDIARSLVVNVGEVAAVLNEMRKASDAGDRYPVVARFTDGTYVIEGRRAA